MIMNLYRTIKYSKVLYITLEFKINKINTLQAFLARNKENLLTLPCILQNFCKVIFNCIISPHFVFSFPLHYSYYRTNTS